MQIVNVHFSMVKITFPDISSPKPQSVYLFCLSIVMFTSVQGSVIQRQQLTKSMPSNSGLFLSKVQK